MPGSRLLDIKANRRHRKYTRHENIMRVLWALFLPLFRFSPRVAYGWRAFLLRLFGARVGCRVQIYPTVDIFAPWALEIGDESAIGHRVLLYNLGNIQIGHQVTISHRALLCAGTHDYTLSDLPLLKPPITIKDRAWICTDVFVGPGVTIGEGAVVGARAVVVKNVEPWTVVAGNPARFIKMRIMRKNGSCGQ